MSSNYLRKYKQWKQTKCLAVVALTCSGLLEKERRSRGKTRKWIKRRETQGFFQNIVRELIAEDTQTYREMMRMTYPDFLALLGVIEPHIAPRQIVGGNKVIAAERLTLTIRYLAMGESYRSLSFQFRISVSGISYIISNFTIYLFLQINKKFKYFCLTFRSPLRKPLSKTMKLKVYRY